MLAAYSVERRTVARDHCGAVACSLLRGQGHRSNRGIMTTQQATLLAACIAAVGTLATLIGTMLASRRAEMRASHRAALTPHLDNLGEGIHQVVASAKILRQRAVDGAEPGNWLERSKTGAATLKSVRPKCRYVLNGLDDPLRTLTRMPDWVATYKNIEGTNADDLVDGMRKLAEGIDRAVQRSYRHGLPPGRFRRWLLKRQNKAVRDLWDQRFAGLSR